MDFFEDLFELGDRKRRKHGDGHYDKHHEHGRDEYYKDEHHEHDHGYYENTPRQGTLCPRCSSQIIQGSKFCQNCGVAINVALNCSGCGSKITANATFCPECGKKLK